MEHEVSNVARGRTLTDKHLSVTMNEPQAKNELRKLFIDAGFAEFSHVISTDLIKSVAPRVTHEEFVMICKSLLTKMPISVQISEPHVANWYKETFYSL